MSFVRLATIVLVQNDGDFVDLNQLYCVSTFTQVKNMRANYVKIYIFGSNCIKEGYSTLIMGGYLCNVGLRKIIPLQILFNCYEEINNQIYSYRFKLLSYM